MSDMEIETPLPVGRTYKLTENARATWPRWEHGLTVFKLPGECGWMVSSSRVDRGFWLVTWGDDPETGRWVTCQCDWGRERGRMYARDRDVKVCRHVTAVRDAEQHDGHPPRPRARVGDTSRFVD